MPLVTAIPDVMEAAAIDLANIGSRIRAADAAAALPTTGVLAAGADEVSAAVAAMCRRRASWSTYLGIDVHHTGYYTTCVV